MAVDRLTASSNKLDSPINGTNCFGKLCLDSGHRRDPTPPHKTIGTILCINAPFLLMYDSITEKTKRSITLRAVDPWQVLYELIWYVVVLDHSFNDKNHILTCFLFNYAVDNCVHLD